MEKEVTTILENHRLVKIINKEEEVIGTIIGNDGKNIPFEELHYYIKPIGNPFNEIIVELCSNVEAFPIKYMGMGIDGELVTDADGVFYYIDISHDYYKKLFTK